MKTIKIITIFLFLFMGSSAFSSTIHFDVNFENYSTGNIAGQDDWTGDTTSFEISETKKYTGDKSLRVKTFSGWRQISKAFDVPIASSTSDTIYQSFAVNLSKGLGSSSFGVSLSGSKFALAGAHSYYNEDGTKIGSASLAITDYDFDLGTWYRFLVVTHYDKSNRLYQIYVLEGEEWVEYDLINSGVCADWSCARIFPGSLNHIEDDLPGDITGYSIWGINPSSNDYIDDIYITNENIFIEEDKDNVTWLDQPYITGSGITGFGRDFWEYTINGTTTARVGYRIIGKNPEEYKTIKMSVEEEDETPIITNQLFSLTGYWGSTAWSFQRDFILENITEDMLPLKFTFQMCDEDGDNCKTAQFFYDNLDFSTPEYTEQDLIDRREAPISFGGDRFGIGGFIQENLNKILDKFPFSWVRDIYNVWKEKETEIQTKSAIAPYVLEIEVDGSAWGGSATQTFALVDFEEANSKMASTFVFFRLLLTYSLWLGFILYVISRAKSTIKSLDK